MSLYIRVRQRYHTSHINSTDTMFSDINKELRFLFLSSSFSSVPSEPDKVSVVKDLTRSFHSNTTISK